MPATLLAVLRTSAHAWQQDALTSNARELLVLGRELHERLATLGTHVTRMGSSLRRSVETYNAMVGTLESRVLVTSRKLHELDLAPEAVPAPPPVDLPTRPLTAAELIENTALENTALENTALEGCDLERDARHVRDTVTDARPLGRRADSA